jgi:hypothetical protein
VAGYAAAGCGIIIGFAPGILLASMAIFSCSVISSGLLFTGGGGIITPPAYGAGSTVVSLNSIFLTPSLAASSSRTADTDRLPWISPSRICLRLFRVALRPAWKERVSTVPGGGARLAVGGGGGGGGGGPDPYPGSGGGGGGPDPVYPGSGGGGGGPAAYYPGNCGTGGGGANSDGCSLLYGNNGADGSGKNALFDSVLTSLILLVSSNEFVVFVRVCPIAL